MGFGIRMVRGVSSRTLSPFTVAPLAGFAFTRVMLVHSEIPPGSIDGQGRIEEGA